NQAGRDGRAQTPIVSYHDDGAQAADREGQAVQGFTGVRKGRRGRCRLCRRSRRRDARGGPRRAPHASLTAFSAPSHRLRGEARGEGPLPRVRSRSEAVRSPLIPTVAPQAGRRRRCAYFGSAKYGVVPSGSGTLKTLRTIETAV